MRFDIIMGASGAYIEPHFCREWDEEGGCYGTREDHGLSLEEACKEMAFWHESQASLWAAKTHRDLAYYRQTVQETVHEEVGK